MDDSGSSPPKRRSSFFQRRDSLVPKPTEENVPDVEKAVPLNEQYESYLELLEKEHNDWKELYLSRKNETHSLKRQLQEATSSVIIKDEHLDCIVPDDVKDFVESKPDIHKILEESIQFVERFNATFNIHDNLLINNGRIRGLINFNTNKFVTYVCEKNEKLYKNLM